MSTIEPHNLNGPLSTRERTGERRAGDGPVIPPSARHRKSSRRKKNRGDLRWLVSPKKRRPLFEVPHVSSASVVNDSLHVDHPSPAAASHPAMSAEVQSSKLAAIIDSKVAARQERLQQRVQQKRRSVDHRYFGQTRRPIVALCFVLPLIVIYEIAKIFIGLQTACSGIDFWVHQVLSAFGVGQLVILPMLTTAMLLIWHHRRDDHCYFQPTLLPWMMLEAMGLGLMLFVCANLFQIAFTGHPDAGAVADPYHWTIGSSAWWSNVVTFIGTGIHEELIFRVLLMLPVMWALQPLMTSKRGPLVVAAMISSALFAIAHVDWFNPAGDSYNETAFLFRLFAAAIFSALFSYRGFAIVVGTHITYNVLTLISI